MAAFTYNQNMNAYEAIDGGHTISISDDAFKEMLEELQSLEGMSEAKAFDTLVDDVGWWYHHLPLKGVFIDGVEADGTHDLLTDGSHDHLSGL